MKKNYGVVIPDENLFSAVQKITFSNGAYGFYVETGLGCALVFPSGKAVYDVKFFGEHSEEVYNADDAEYIKFRDGRIYAISSEWIELRDECDEWRYLEGFFTFDMSEPVFVKRSVFEEVFSRFQNTIFYEPLAHYACFCDHPDA